MPHPSPPAADRSHRLAHLAARAAAARAPARFGRLDAAALSAGADPDPLAGERWRMAMLAGDLARAWACCDAESVRRAANGARCDHLPPHRRWEWDGTPPDGRSVLVLCHHGLGDVAMAARLLPSLARRAREVAVLAPAPLRPLLARSLPQVAWVAAEHAAELRVELLELPHLLRLAAEDLPGPLPYLRGPDGAQRRGYRAAARRRVGVAWAAGGWKPERSVPFAALAETLAAAGLAPVRLQRGPALADDDGRLAWAECLEGDDADATAALIAGCDLVVSVDTFVAHLAGGMGVPLALLLHWDAEWRWGIADRSLWYSDATLLRQRRPGDWSAPLTALAALLGAVR